MYHQFEHSQIISSVHTAYLRVTEQTAIISLYRNNWLVFTTESESVYCAVRTKYLTMIQVNFGFHKVKLNPIRFIILQRQTSMHGRDSNTWTRSAVVQGSSASHSAINAKRKKSTALRTNFSNGRAYQIQLKTNIIRIRVIYFNSDAHTTTRGPKLAHRPTKNCLYLSGLQIPIMTMC